MHRLVEPTGGTPKANKTAQSHPSQTVFRVQAGLHRRTEGWRAACGYTTSPAWSGIGKAARRGLRVTSPVARASGQA